MLDRCAVSATFDVQLDLPMALVDSMESKPWTRLRRAVRRQRITALGALCLLAGAAAAQTTVYRWVDDSGRVNYSETVPERYRSVARPITVPAAAAPAEAPRASAGTPAASKPASAAQPVARVPPPVPLKPAGKRPARVPDENTDCETWQRLYFESIDCFGPYRTVRGGIKPEAFERCNEVPEPPVSRCRLRLP
jgi:hypothetical protein